MRIVIGSDAEGMPLKETVKAYLVELGHEVVDKSEEPAADLVDSTLAVAHDLLENPDSPTASALPSTATATAPTWPPARSRAWSPASAPTSVPPS